MAPQKRNTENRTCKSASSCLQAIENYHHVPGFTSIINNRTDHLPGNRSDKNNPPVEKKKHTTSDQEQLPPPLIESVVSCRLKKPSLIPFTDFQLKALEREFESSFYPSRKRLSQLSAVLLLTERQIQKWFVYRRKKLRRDMVEGCCNETSDFEHSTMSDEEQEDSPFTKFSGAIWYTKYWSYKSSDRLV